MEAEERHMMAEERYREMLRMTKQQEEELRRQLAVVKATIEKPTVKRLARHPFLIAAMHWLATLPPQSIKMFGDLATSFATQFTANKTKRLEVADLFNIKQGKGETLKNYMAHFNNATAFQKGLRAGQFSNSLALRRPLTMEEIRARAEKHIEVEEDQANRLEVEKQPRIGDTRPTQKGENRYPNKPKEYPPMLTRLREKRTQILHKIYHTNLLKLPRDVKGRWLGPNTQEWCEFHKAYGHSIKDCQNLKRRSTQGNPLEAEEGREAKRKEQVTTKEEHMKQGCHYNNIKRRRRSTSREKPEKEGRRCSCGTMKSLCNTEGSSANMLYWSMYVKMGLKSIDMEPYTRKLYGFAGEQVEIRGAVELETTFGEGNHT
ncbi:hypothetical protein CR513_33633, partial [Mucuna pruriens]